MNVQRTSPPVIRHRYTIGTLAHAHIRLRESPLQCGRTTKWTAFCLTFSIPKSIYPPLPFPFPAPTSLIHSLSGLKLKPSLFPTSLSNTAKLHILQLLHHRGPPSECQASGCYWKKLTRSCSYWNSSMFTETENRS